MNNVSKEILELPIHERAALAMDAALKKAVEEHTRKGLPMYVWRDEKVAAVPAEELLKKA
jgi:hypothetical protein